MVRLSQLAKLTIILCACMAIAACSGRSKRAIAVDPAPKPAVEEKPGQGGVDPGSLDAGAGGQQTQIGDLGAESIDANNNGIPDAEEIQGTDSIIDVGTDSSQPGQGTQQPGTQQPGTQQPGTQQPGTGTTDVIIEATLDNGQATTVNWDGQSFKGNARWDVVPIP